LIQINLSTLCNQLSLIFLKRHSVFLLTLPNNFC